MNMSSEPVHAGLERKKERGIESNVGNAVVMLHEDIVIAGDQA
jgi:hypothetical protein